MLSPVTRRLDLVSAAGGLRCPTVDKLISADSHVVEPPDLFVTRIDARYRDRAPRVVSDGGVDRWIAADDITVGSIGAPTQAGRRFVDKESLSLEFSYEEATRAAYDPHVRMTALERDGVVGEVVFPTIAVRLIETAIDTDLLSACCRAINDWMAQDFSGAHPETIKGAALLNLDDVDEAVAELERRREDGSGCRVHSGLPGARAAPMTCPAASGCGRRPNHSGVAAVHALGLLPTGTGGARRVCQRCLAAGDRIVSGERGLLGRGARSRT